MSHAVQVNPPQEPDLGALREVSLASVRAAADRIGEFAHRTQVLRSRSLDALAGGRALFLKGEHTQRVGAFKFRGAVAALTAMEPRQRARGVLAYSSGNHAQAVALAGALTNTPTVIVMPSNAPRVKLDATRGYLGEGGEIVIYDPQTESREAMGASIAAQRGLTVIPPYDHADVISGQGTAALELLEDHPDLDALYVCVGGGGLISGCATVAGELAPACRVVGVEPEAGDDATLSYQTRLLHEVRNPPTIADGARTPYLGRLTFPIVLERVHAMRTVADADLAWCVCWAMQRLKAVFEPTGTLALAGVLRDIAEGHDPGARVGVIISGGNLDLQMVPDLQRLSQDSTLLRLSTG